MTQLIQMTPREFKRLMKRRPAEATHQESRIPIPTYEEALERHETPLDAFVSLWEPVDSGTYRKHFQEDLAALIEYVIEVAEKGQIK